MVGLCANDFVGYYTYLQIPGLVGLDKITDFQSDGSVSAISFEFPYLAIVLMTERVNHRVLRQFVPVCNLTSDNFDELAKKAVVEHIGAGNALFKEGQKDSKTFYLLNGEIEIKSPNGGSLIVVGGSKESLQPLANRQPRQETAIARTDVSFIGIDTDMLDVLLTWDQTASYVVTEINTEDSAEDDSDWMTKILQSNVFMQIPPANIQKMFMQMEQLPVQPGETIMRQGDPGDYYYIIQRGSCEVSRAAPDGRQIKLAVLQQGDGFGEEALISDTVRNATITMVTEGSLMRLSKEDFDELLRQPVLNNVTYEQAQKMMEDGATLVDVRLENEFEGGNITGSVNIPLYLLRIRLAKMDPSAKYIVYCDSGGRSSAAAYILSEKGINVSVLSGGMQGVSES